MRYLFIICLSWLLAVPSFADMHKSVNCADVQTYHFDNDGDRGSGTSDHLYESLIITPANAALSISIDGTHTHADITITWNPDFTGVAQVSMYHKWHYQGQDRGETLIEEIFNYGKNVAPFNFVSNQPELWISAGYVTFNKIYNVSDYPAYANATFSMYKYNAAGELVPVTPTMEQTGGIFGVPYAKLAVTEIGRQSFIFKVVAECGNREYWSPVYSIDVLPNCANVSAAAMTPTMGIAPVAEEQVIAGGYPLNGSYKLDAGDSYNLLLKWGTVVQDYNVVSNNPAAITLGTLNPFDLTVPFSVNADLGNYTIDIVKTDKFGMDRCPDFPSFKISVGGQNYVFPTSNCLIKLPQYLINKGMDDPLILKNFVYTMSSKKGIVVQPGMVLNAGAILKLDAATPDPGLASDDNINHTDVTTYDDAGNITGQARSYFNEKGINIQNQAKNLSAGVILATETLYDIYDRPALTTLAAPVAVLPVTSSDGCGDPVSAAYDMYFSYKDNFIKNSGGTNYDYNSFDGSKELNPDVVTQNTLGTLGWYYSSNNKSGAVVDNSKGEDRFIETGVATTSYPYSRILYYNDGTNRVKSSTLPGDYHKAGSGKYSVSDIQVLSSNDAILADYLAIRNTQVLTGDNDNIKRPSVSDMSGSVYIEQATDMNGLQSLIYKNREGLTLISLLKDNTGTESQRSYVFYDDLGRVLASVSPNGYEQLHKSTPVAYGLIDKSAFKYDGMGRLIETSGIDGGTTKFIYRQDGSVRFSQDAKQALSGKFSYINYDAFERPYESGVFTPASGSAYTFNSDELKAAAEIAATNELLTTGGTKSEISIVHYDLPDENGPLADASFTIGAVAWTEKADEGSNVFKTWYSYDEQGRIVTMVRQIAGLGNKTVAYKYYPNGQVMEVAYQAGQADVFYHVYTYDADTRLSKVFTGTIEPQYDNTSLPTNLTEQAAYTYYKHGPLKSVNIAENLQKIDYTYTAQGWLKAINNPKDLSTDVFAEQLEYFDNDYNTPTGTGNAGVSRFDGLPRASFWYTQRPAGATPTALPEGYIYTYDKRYRLVKAKWAQVGETGFNSTIAEINVEDSLAYDANGNIISLKRYDSAGDVLHSFVRGNKYQYEGNSNKLTSVPGYANYSYNNIGQLTQQTLLASNTTRNFDYTTSGLTKSIKSGTNTLAAYIYGEGDQLAKKTQNNGIQTYYVRDASGNVLAIYEKGAADAVNLKERPIYGTNRLGNVYYSLGIGSDNTPVVTATNIYELTDHLGSTRARFSKETGGTIKVESYADYYPFGLAQKPEYKGNIPSRNGYQGDYSEYNESTGLNEFELRQYDPVVGRWNSMDPYGQYPSGYVGMGNNPVIGVDPNGGWCPTCPSDGSFSYAVNSKDTYVYENGSASLVGGGNGGTVLPEVTITGSRAIDFGTASFSPNATPMPNYSQNGTISQFEPNWAGKLKTYIDAAPWPNKMVYGGLYSTANDLYSSFGQIGNIESRHDLEGFGLTRSEVTTAGVNTMMNYVPIGKLSAPLIKGVTIAQFNKVVGGTAVARLSPQIKGMVTTQINSRLVKPQIEMYVNFSKGLAESSKK